MPKLLSDVVKHHTEEAACDHCGGPIYVGDRLYHRADDPRAWCSRHCAAYAESDDERRRSELPFAHLWQDAGGEG